MSALSDEILKILGLQNKFGSGTERVGVPESDYYAPKNKALGEGGTLQEVIEGMANFHYRTSAWDSFDSLLTAIGSDEVTLLINSTVAITANLTVPSNISVVYGGGSFSVATGVTLTIAKIGHWPKKRMVTLTGTGALVMSIGATSEVFTEWFGLAADGSTNDFTPLQAAMTASAACRAPLMVQPGTIISNSPLVCASYLKMIGAGKWITKIKSGLTTGQNNLFTVASSVTYCEFSDFSVEGVATSTADSTRAFIIDGQYLKFRDILFLNVWRGIVASKTVRHLRIEKCDCELTVGSAANIFILASVETFWITDCTFTGTDSSIKINRAVALENGGTMWGCRFGTVRNNFCNGADSPAFGGNPDTNFKLIKNSSFSADPISSDIGKTFVQGANTGTVRGYDVFRKFVVVETSATIANSSAWTITSGTGAGTTISAGARVNAPTMSDCVLDGNIVTGGISSSLGSGIALDATYRNVCSGNILVENNSRGIFMGDATTEGCVVSGNITYHNDQSGIDMSGGEKSVIMGNSSQYNLGSGIRSEPSVAGRCDLSVVLGNSLIFNGHRVGADAYDSGLGLTGMHQGVVVGNLSSRNNWHGLYLLNGTKNVVASNSFIDNNENNNAGETDGIRTDGTCTKNQISVNLASRYSHSNQDAAINVGSNGDDNNLIGNMFDGHGTNVTDSGLRNYFNSNMGELADVSNFTSLAAAGVVSLTAKTGELLVLDRTNNRFGVFLLRGGSNTVLEVSDPTGNFSVTAGTATSINVYYSSGYKLENNLAGAADICVFLRGGG